MLSYNHKPENKEIGKLIQYGYDLHRREMKSYSHAVPNFEYNNGNSCDIKLVDNGGIFGMRCYANHSDPTLYTILGICVGKFVDNNFKFEYALKFDTNNEHYGVFFNNLKLIKKEKRWYQTLDYDHDNDWDKMSDEEKLEKFLQAMKFIGFKEEDVISVINGTMTAQEAYRNVAPEEIKNIEWVSTYRRYFEFDGNVAISGDFGSMNLDRFPFPFEGQPILDCSKVKTSCVHFDNNIRKVKLINVNSNVDSIRYTNIKNAIIDEVISLSKVNAACTVFGHHKVSNIEYSIAPIEDMDLRLAVNEEGKKYEIDKDGKLVLDEFFEPKIISEENNRDLFVLANADNNEMAIDAITNQADGIGLVRTEYMFTELEDIREFVNLFVHYGLFGEENNYYEEFRKKQIKQAKEIFQTSSHQSVIFRLFDFKLADFLKQISESLEYDEEEIEIFRGACFLNNNHKLLKAQCEAIFEVAEEYGREVNLLVPMVNSNGTFERIKSIIEEASHNFKLKDLKVGAMIETVSMAKNAELLATSADFISIGTSDLTEDVTCVSRDSNRPEFYELSDEVKELMGDVVYRIRAFNNDTLIGVCGEHGNYPDNVLFYKDLGVDYITCNSSFVLANKNILDSNNTVKQFVLNKKID